MSAGVIPVVLDRGGVGDIVRHGQNGYLAPTPADVGAFTKTVFQLEAPALEALRRCARFFFIHSFMQCHCSAWVQLHGMRPPSAATTAALPSRRRTHKHPPPSPRPCLAHTTLRRNAVSWVERFAPKAFGRKFRALANRGVLTKPFRFLIQETAGAPPRPPAPACPPAHPEPAAWRLACCRTPAC